MGAPICALSKIKVGLLPPSRGRSKRAAFATIERPPSSNAAFGRTVPPKNTPAWNCLTVGGPDGNGGNCTPCAGTRPSDPGGVPATLDIGRPRKLVRLYGVRS